MYPISESQEKCKKIVAEYRNENETTPVIWQSSADARAGVGPGYWQAIYQGVSMRDKDKKVWKAELLFVAPSTVSKVQEIVGCKTCEASTFPLLRKAIFEAFEQGIKDCSMTVDDPERVYNLPAILEVRIRVEKGNGCANG